MVNIKSNSIELSAQKFKSLIQAASVFTEDRLQKINKYYSNLKEKQLILNKKIEYLNKLVEAFDLNKAKENKKIYFIQFFLHSCQQQQQIISFILENVDQITTAVNVCSSPVNQGPITPDVLRSNLPLLNNFVLSLQKIDLIYKFMGVNYQSIKDVLEKYYSQLIERHTIDNIQIYNNIFITDFCYLFLNSFNEEDKNFKLNLIQNDLKNEILQDYLQDSHLFDADLEGDLKSLVKISGLLQSELQSDIFEIKNIVGSSYNEHDFKAQYINNIINQIKTLNLSGIEYKENILDKDNLQYKSINSFIEPASSHILNQSLTSQQVYSLCCEEVVKARSATLSTGFYTCRIASGGPDNKDGAGALELVPKEKPNVTLDNIVGSGFEEIKNFLYSIKFTAQWNDLFLATSPSKTTDKSNVLLVGPPGCGKTEILRAVASDKDSISVFAQGSDFLTCWRGEAEKNPKRLFEEGVKLHKQSKKQVHFLIDEIDSVLSSNNKPGEVNLSLEFQVLMDGVINYSGLSVWGATNFLERIPPAMVRRFNFVNIVGELDQGQRVMLLEHFINFMPHKNFERSDWENAALRLNGATGNVIRKIADYVWRDKMKEFVTKYPDQASELVKWLNKDGKFDINQFSEDNKNELKSRLSNYAFIDPDYLNKVIDYHLNNLAFKAEIQTAVLTYANAKKILNQL